MRRVVLALLVCAASVPAFSAERDLCDDLPAALAALFAGGADQKDQRGQAQWTPFPSPPERAGLPSKFAASLPADAGGGFKTPNGSFAFKAACQDQPEGGPAFSGGLTVKGKAGTKTYDPTKVGHETCYPPTRAWCVAGRLFLFHEFMDDHVCVTNSLDEWDLRTKKIRSNLLTEEKCGGGEARLWGAEQIAGYLLAGLDKVTIAADDRRIVIRGPGGDLALDDKDELWTFFDRKGGRVPAEPGILGKAAYDWLDAAEKGNPEKLRALLADGKHPVDARDQFGHTALYRLIERWTPQSPYCPGPGDCHFSEAAKVLADAGADPNAADILGVRPIHIAAGDCHARAVAVLSSLRADLSAPDREGSTPVQLAQSYNAFWGSQGEEEAQKCTETIQFLSSPEVRKIQDVAKLSPEGKIKALADAWRAGKALSLVKLEIKHLDADGKKRLAEVFTADLKSSGHRLQSAITGLGIIGPAASAALPELNRIIQTEESWKVYSFFWDKEPEGAQVSMSFVGNDDDGTVGGTQTPASDAIDAACGMWPAGAWIIREQVKLQRGGYENAIHCLNMRARLRQAMTADAQIYLSLILTPSIPRFRDEGLQGLRRMGPAARAVLPQISAAAANMKVSAPWLQQARAAILNLKDFAAIGTPENDGEVQTEFVTRLVQGATEWIHLGSGIVVPGHLTACLYSACHFDLGHSTRPLSGRGLVLASMGPSETSPIAQFLTIEPDPKLDAPLRQAVERGVSEEAVKLFPPPYPSPRLTMRLYGVGKEVRLLRVNAAYDAGKSSGTLSVDFAIKNGVLTARKVVRSGKGECPESANEFYDNIFDFGADGSPQVIERFAFFDSSRNPPSCQQTTRVYQIGEDGLPAEPPMLQIDPPPPEDDEVDL